MSTRVFRTLHDSARHRWVIEFTCHCGQKVSVPLRPVIGRFSWRRWPIGLAASLGRFRCSKCGRCPACLGPLER